MRLRPVLQMFLICAAVLCGAACTSTPAPPAPPSKPPFEFLGEWGTPGEGPGKLYLPVSLAVDFAGNVYVADAGSGFVHKFDPLGKPLLSFQDDLLRRPVGVAVDDGEGIYVVDLLGNRVLIYFPDGRRLRAVRGGRARPLQRPSAIAVDKEGVSFVLEGPACRIRKFNAQSRIVAVWGKCGPGNGEMQFPADIALAPDGSVFAVDASDLRVHKFTADGQFVNKWKAAKEPQAEKDPLLSGIAASDKFVFVADAANNIVQVWTHHGQQRYAHRVDPHIVGTDKLPSAVDVAWSPRGELLALDQARRKVMRFRVNLP